MRPKIEDRRSEIGKWEPQGGISGLIRVSFWKATRKWACRWTPKNSPPFALRMTPAVLENILSFLRMLE